MHVKWTRVLIAILVALLVGVVALRVYLHRVSRDAYPPVIEKFGPWELHTETIFELDFLSPFTGWERGYKGTLYYKGKEWSPPIPGDVVTSYCSFDRYTSKWSSGWFPVRAYTTHGVEEVTEQFSEEDSRRGWYVLFITETELDKRLLSLAYITFGFGAHSKKAGTPEEWVMIMPTYDVYCTLWLDPSRAFPNLREDDVCGSTRIVDAE